MRCSYLEWVEATVITGSSLFLTCSQKLRLYDPWPYNCEQIRQWRGFSRVVKPVAHRWLCLILWQTLTLSESILQTCNIIPQTIYSFKRLQTCGSKWSGKNLHYSRPCVCICHFLLGTYSIRTVLIQYHTVRTALLLAEICNLHIYYIFLSSIYSVKYHLRAQSAKIS